MTIIKIDTTHTEYSVSRDKNGTSGIIGSSGVNASSSGSSGSSGANASSSGSSGSSGTSGLSNVEPTILSLLVSDITSTGATYSGELVMSGSTTVTEIGVVYKAGSTGATTADTKIANGSVVQGAPFVINIVSLTPETTYYARSYAIDGVSTTYATLDLEITTTA